MSKVYDDIYAMVCRIPEGRVATYGLIARLIHRPRGARQVGYALAALNDDRQVPWHRVVNAQGGVSPRAKGGYEEYQRILLESEGVTFDASGRIDLSQYLWCEPAEVR
jgi:methylated-DNA-protein-cysteine methyltransferase-like protein